MRLGFREDTRGVSALVGAVLLLGILVIALASYQAIIVPQQNAQTEFDHNQQVEDEMVDFRNALLEARLDNRERATSVKLGTRYQSRTLAVNPPPATGTLQSTDQGEITVDGTNVELFNLQNNLFFEYTPSYSEYRDAGTIRYENTLVYHDFGSDNITLSNQRLLTDESPSGFDVDGTIRLVPSEPGIDEQGVDRVSYEPTPERARFVTVTDPEITLPTELAVESQDRTNWEDLLGGQVDESEISEGPNGELVLELEGDYVIIYSFVGATDDFPEDERDQDDEADEGDDDDAETEVNPAGEGALQFEEADFDNREAILTFRNNAENAKTITGARIPFYFAERQGNVPKRVVSISADDENADEDENRLNNDLAIRADFEEVDPNIVVPGDEDSFDIILEFDSNANRQDFFILTLQFDNGQRSTYFISTGE